jgi:hypothetical protein
VNYSFLYVCLLFAITFNNGTWTANPSGAIAFIPICSVLRVAKFLVFCVMFCRPLLVHLSVILWPLCCLSFFDILLLITSLVSSIYGFWLPLWYLRYTASDYPFGVFDIRFLITSLVSSIYGFWLPLWYLRYTASDYLFGIFDIRLLITSLVSSIYGFWLPLWYLRYTASDYFFGIFDIRLLITSLVSSNCFSIHYAIIFL